MAGRRLGGRVPRPCCDQQARVGCGNHGSVDIAILVVGVVAGCVLLYVVRRKHKAADRVSN